MIRAGAILAVLTVLALSFTNFIGSVLGSIQGCAEAGEVLLNDAFTPESDMRSRPRVLKISDMGLQLPPDDAIEAVGFDVLVPAKLDVELRTAVVSDGASVAADGVRMLYGPAPVQPSDTLQQFLQGGGSLLVQRPSTNQTADVVVHAVGDRATLVRVGPWQAAMVHADPIGGYRSHNLYWNDGERDLFIISGMSSARVLNMARSMYCSGQ